MTALLVWWTDRADHSEGDAEVLATGLEVPWGLTFLPTGEALVGERSTGRIYRIPADGGERTLVGTVPGVVPDGEGGLLGLAVDPLFIHDSFVYAYLTAAADNRIIRFRLDAGRAGGLRREVVLDGIAKAGNHDGGALAFGPDGMLYAGVGDAGVPARAQDPRRSTARSCGWTRSATRRRTTPIRTRSSGRWGTATCKGSPGTRSGRLWATEFGQDTFDEVNLIEPGGNYGWPEVEGVGDDDRFIDPMVTWSTDEASPSGLAIAGDTLYVAALRGERLWTIPLSGGRARHARGVLEGQYGRLRNVQVAPDGSLWITTSNRDGRGDPDGDDDRVLRLETGDL